MMRLSSNVPTYLFGVGATNGLADILSERRKISPDKRALFLIDTFFRTEGFDKKFYCQESDLLIWVDSSEEPTTDLIDAYVARVRSKFGSNIVPCAVVGIGGGCALDSAKAVSNLISNLGKAEDYQGWDMLKHPGVFKIGVPTLSGTGAEASRTCVMTNLKKNIKLGMNSRFSVFDHLILDPVHSATVSRDQYFYTAMDTYIHCVESLRGSYRHALADSFSREAINLIREVFNSDDMMTLANREKVMVASYLGGASIANTYVGVVHPLSAGLSTVLHLHHCVANCIVMKVMDDFYGDEAEEFRSFVARQRVRIPSAVCAGLPDDDFVRLYESAIIHEKPLTNALGPGFKDILTPKRMSEIYKAM
jgi:3-deoxy-alpha-D-manno-octulosonate 8-oxidase